MAAAIGVERAEQAMLANHLAQGLERRRRPFFLDQQHRINLARCIVHRDDQVHRRQTFDPAVARPVLVQQHARKRPPWTLLAVRRSLRSEEHTSELQSHVNLVCRLLLEKKKKKQQIKTKKKKNKQKN